MKNIGWIHTHFQKNFSSLFGLALTLSLSRKYFNSIQFFFVPNILCFVCCSHCDGNKWFGYYESLICYEWLTCCISISWIQLEKNFGKGSLVLVFLEKKPRITIDEKLGAKLKPYQIDGVRCMWNACFESTDTLTQESGGGCILAHCMGLDFASNHVSSLTMNTQTGN